MKMHHLKAIKMLFFFLVLLFTVYSQPASEKAQELIINSDSELTIDVTLIVEDRLYKANWHQAIVQWVEFCSQKLKETANIRLSVIDIHSWMCPPPVKDGFMYMADHGHNAESWKTFMDICRKEIRAEFQPKHCITIAFFYGIDEIGKALNTESEILCFTTCTEPLINQWMLLHELAHLFGLTPHLTKFGYVMNTPTIHDEEWMKEYEPQFDPREVAILKIAKQEMMERNWTAFDLENCSEQKAKEILLSSDQLMTVYEDPVPLYMYRGNYYFNRKSYLDAIQEYDKGIEILNRYSAQEIRKYGIETHKKNFYISKAAALMKANQKEKAVETMALAYPDNADSVDKLENYARLYFDLGEIDQAIQCYRKITEMSPDYASGWFNLGMHHIMKVPLEEWSGSEIEETKRCLLKSIELGFAGPEPFYVLSVIYLKEQDRTKALEYLKNAHVIRPGFELSFPKKGGMFNESVAFYLMTNDERDNRNLDY